MGTRGALTSHKVMYTPSRPRNTGGTDGKSNSIPYQHKITPTLPTREPILERGRRL